METTNNTFNKNFFLSLTIALCFFALIFFILERQESKSVGETNFEVNSEASILGVKIGGQTLKVELAVTPAEQKQGLSGRKELKAEQGMLFVFKIPGIYSFWMREMNFSIDIIWIGEDGKIVYIKKNATPESYPELFGLGEYAKYVLEVVSGFSDKNNLKAGDKLEFIY